MKFTCNKSELSEAIGSVSKAVSIKSTIAALEGIKVRVSEGEVELTGYNLEIGIRTSIKAETEGNGEFVASVRLFSEFTRRMSEDEVTVEIDENLTVRMSSRATECTFTAISAQEYPELPKVDTARIFTVKQNVLRSMINMTGYAASTNESKPVLTGELFDIENGSFNMVAIDGFRLAIRNEPTECQDKYYFVVPKKALMEVSALARTITTKSAVSLQIIAILSSKSTTAPSFQDSLKVLSITISSVSRQVTKQRSSSARETSLHVLNAARLSSTKKISVLSAAKSETAL